jgi:hypothetical protein
MRLRRQRSAHRQVRPHLPADNVKFTAGADKLLVLHLGTASVERWALGTWQREASNVLPATATVKPSRHARDSVGPHDLGGAADPSVADANIVLSVSDRSGQELFHSVRITVLR